MIKIEIKNDDHFLPKGMKLEIVKKKRINNRLYRFVIKHEEHKYVNIQHAIDGWVASDSFHKTNILEILQLNYKDDWEKAQGGRIEITGIEDVIFSFTNLKYETLVFMILDPFKEGDV